MDFHIDRLTEQHSFKENAPTVMNNLKILSTAHSYLDI